MITMMSLDGYNNIICGYNSIIIDLIKIIIICVKVFTIKILVHLEGCYTLYAIVNTGQNFDMKKFSPMRADDKFSHVMQICGLKGK